MQEHSFHKEGSDLGGSPEGRKGNPSGQAEMEKLIFTEQMETDHRDKTIKSFAENILRLGNECRALADENSRLKAEVERLEGLVKYWQIEAETDHAHWVRHAETNERLRKAGDALQKRLYVLENPTHPEVYLKLLSAWNAAKEGKPTV